MQGKILRASACLVTELCFYVYSIMIVGVNILSYVQDSNWMITEVEVKPPVVSKFQLQLVNNFNRSWKNVHSVINSMDRISPQFP